MQNKDVIYRIVYAGVFVVVAAIVVAAQILKGENLILFIKEGGVVETLSAVGYLLCVVLLVSKGGTEILKRHWYFVVALLAFTAREFDFDKRFTPVGIFKSKFLVSPEVGLGTKVIGAAILLFLLFTLVTILRKYAGRFFKTLTSGTLFELSIVTAVVSLLVAKGLDGLARKLRGIYEVSPEMSSLASNVEEALEFGAPCLFALAILIYFDRASKS